MLGTNSTQSIDDLNWGRLNLISAVDRVDSQDFWSVQSIHNGRQVRVTCQALQKHGVPHGLDNDVSSALIDLLMTSGLPESGSITVTLSELMRLAGFHRTGKYRTLLRESLERLNTTNFEVSGGWRDHPNRRWITTTFHFIESITYTHQGEAGVFDERTIIQIRLADQLVASMRSGYTKPLNMTFMQSLSRPRTRILFRLLDATRYDPENPGVIADTLDVGLVEWADQCKISSARPADVRRALEGPHEELKSRGYLREVTISGWGSKQRLFYEFAPDFTQIDPVLLTRLRRHGVTDGVSRALAQTYSTSLLFARVEQFEQLIRSGKLIPKKSAAAALVHLIKNPDQYSLATRTPSAISNITRSTPGTAVLAVTAHEPTLTERVQAMTAEERGTYLTQQLSLLMRNKLSVLEFDRLRDRAASGELDVAAVVGEALRAVSEGRTVDFLKTIRDSLQQRLFE